MNTILEKVNCPDDLKKLPVKDLKTLAAEIRSFILNSVSKTGGHLASSLGVVELTIALHYAFDFQTDKLLWDVGHQCYTHKIITGRKDRFHKIRQKDGLSGFPDPVESPYDQFLVGHAGTSIATAIGIALGQQQLKQKDKIVALVGDASIVNGLSFEALNNLGLVKRQMLIVLNDNSMAIDATQGAVAKYFSKIRLSQTYDDIRRTTNNILEHTPLIGKTVEEAIERIKKTIRMTQPASQMFESLNIPYFGPVDGHDISSLIQLFKALKNLEHPAILHVYTKKGKGFTPAEEDEPRFHSTGPFKINGDSVESDINPAKRSFTSVLGESLVELAEKDEKIVAITAAMCEGTGLTEFSKKFPDRFYDVGIAESAAVDIAAGMAKAGLKPFVCLYSTFLQRGFDQLFQEIFLQKLPVIFCIDRAGLVGADGPTHQGLWDTALLRLMTDFILTSPANETEMRLALDFAVEQKTCVCIRYPRDIVPPEDIDMSACDKPFELGKSVTVKQHEDSVVTLINYGPCLYAALKAAEILEKENIFIDVVNARFAAPLDDDIIGLLNKNKHIITLEDGGITGGFGSAVLAKAAENQPETAKRAKIRILGIPEKGVDRALRKMQLIEAGLDTDNIIDIVKKTIHKKLKVQKKQSKKKALSK